MQHHVITLVGASGPTAEAAAAVAQELSRRGTGVEAPRWLAPGTACELRCAGAVDVEEEVREAARVAAVDLAVQPAGDRRKRLLVADMESTMIRNEMLDELADFAGVGPQVEEITARAMHGELDFASSLRQRTALVAGLPVATLEEALGRVEIEPGAGTLVATMAAHGATTALVSGGFGFFVGRIGKRLGVDSYRANELEIEDGRLTGRVVEPILDRDAKVVALGDYCRQLGVEPEAAVTVGDGANDLAMLRAAGLGVAYHAKPQVAAAARFNVRHGDLRTLLYFQGYAAADFVEPG